MTTATLGEVLPENIAGISTGGRGRSISGGGGGKSESDGGEGNSSTAPFPGAPKIGAFTEIPACWRTIGKLSFPGFGGAAGGIEDSLAGDPEGSGGCANLLTRLSTDGLFDSWYSAELLDFILELR